MTDGFNPYREWLGLETLTPNYYELLGVALQETEQTRIAAAAERAITRVRSFRPGPRARAWSGLLDELRAAKECLIDAEQRSRYDAELAAGLVGQAILPPECEAVTEGEAEAGSATSASSQRDVYSPSGEQLPLPVPVPVPIECLPQAVPVVEQPAAVALASVSRKTIPINSRRGFGWGTVAVIAGLVILVVGLSYRLSVVSGQRRRVQAELAGKQVASRPLVVKQRVVELSKVATGPVDSEKDGDGSLAGGKVNPRPEVVATEAPSATETTVATPSVEPPASVATEEGLKVSRAEVQQLIKSLESAKAAIVIQDFKTADAQLAKGAGQAVLPEHREAVARLKVVGEYVKVFRRALAEAVKEMEAGETFEVGSRPLLFVEGRSDAVVLRSAGKNETYRFHDMPPGLALAIAERKLPANGSASLIAKGAYLLMNKRADSQTRGKAEALWLEAKENGAEISHLLPLLNEDYSALLKDAAD